MSEETWPHFPLAPLAKLTGVSEDALRGRHGVGWNHEPSYWAADSIAIAHGLMPYEVWPEWGDLSIIERSCRECEQMFIPATPVVAYCCHRCRRDAHTRRERERKSRRRRSSA